MTTSNVIELNSYPLREQALRYVRQGWYLAPLHTTRDGQCTCANGRHCHSPAKHPALGKSYKPSNSPDQIAKWWKKDVHYNIGIFPGPSGLVVLDIDPRNGGDEGLAELERKHGKLPDTWRALTGGGGEHYYFVRPEASEVLRSCVIAQGVEVKADKGYVVAPPSLHISGKHYEWDAGAHPSDIGIALLPKWLRVTIEGNKGFEPLQVGQVDEGILGASFMAAGMAGPELGPDKIAVICPWHKEHSEGKDFDGSTVVFAPIKGSKKGWFHCSHAHCQRILDRKPGEPIKTACRRSFFDVIEALPKNAVEAAKERLGVDQLAFKPKPQIDPPPNTAAATSLEKPVDRKWEASLRWKADGTTLCSDAGNCALILANDQIWRDKLTYDAMTDNIGWRESPPQLPGLISPQAGEQLSDEHTTYVQHWLARVRGVKFSTDAVQAGLVLAAKTNQFDSLVAYLEGLKWDGVERINTWLPTYLGATATDFAMWAGRKWLISAVARALKPGCQVDHMLILEGGQGIGKSQAVRIMAGDWFLEGLPDISNKDALVSLAGTWIAEIGELDAIRGANSTKVKEFLTRIKDVYRPPYGRNTVTRARRFVFCGTTNESRYLVDSTGGRRFWPVRCGMLWRDKLERDRDQLWAEAVHRFKKGEVWYPNRDEQRQAIHEQSHRGELDIWEAQLAPLVRQARGAGGDRLPIDMKAIAFALGFDSMSRIQMRDVHRIARILRVFGYRRQRSNTDGKRHYQWVYDPDTAEQQLGYRDVEPSKRDPSRKVPDPRDPLGTVKRFPDED